MRTKIFLKYTYLPIGLNNKYRIIVDIKKKPAKNKEGRYAFNITKNIKQRMTITLSLHPDTILFI